MSSVVINDANGVARKIDTVQRTDGADIVETPAGILLDPAGAAVDPATRALQVALNATLDDLANQLRAISVALDSPRTFDAATQSIQIRLAANQTLAALTTLSTVTTVSTVSSVANIAAIDGLQPRIQIYADDLSAWASAHRARIT